MEINHSSNQIKLIENKVIGLFAKLQADGISVQQFYEQLKSRKSNLEKINFLKDFEDGSSDLENFAGPRKDHGISAEFREKGNWAYAQKQLDKALVAYNLAIRYATPNSTELGLAFANRSAVFQAQQKFHHAIHDIKRALDNSYPQHLHEKLTKRKILCDEAMATANEFEGGIEKAKVRDELKRRRSHCQNFLFKLQNPHNRITDAENFIEIRTNQVFGRHVVVTRDVLPGTVLIVEDPFVVTLKDDLENGLTHCSNCFSALYGSWVPCSGCVFECYCSDTCRSESQNGHHKYECSLSPFLYANQIPSNTIMALRIVCKIGAVELFRLYSTRNPKMTTQSNGSDIVTDETIGLAYNRTDNDAIFQLISNLDQGQEQIGAQDQKGLELIFATMQAITVTQALNSYSVFFEEVQVDKSPDFVHFVASLFLQFIFTVRYNAMSIHEIPLEENEEELLLEMDEKRVSQRIKSLQFSQVGTGLYPLTALLNHSCDPNVARIHGKRNGTMAVIALKPLRAGEQVFNCYGKFFGNSSLAERQDFLCQNYHFKCTCVPCLNDWPTLFQLNQKKTVHFLCSNCQAAPLVPLPDKRFQRCGNCKRKFQTGRLEVQLQESKKKFLEAYKLTLKNQALEALQPLCGFLQAASGVAPPYLQTYVGQETLKQAVGLLVRSTGS